MVTATVTAPDHEVVVIGAGFSGIGAAIKLDNAGVADYLVVDEGDGVGGAWHWNTYPGVAVDIPSFSYQFSFENRADWSRVYAPGGELKAYAEHCVDAYDVRRRLRLNTRITAATFDESEHLWRLDTDAGDVITARFVIGASGALSQPKWPEIEGVDDYAGVTRHTSRWDHTQDLTGKRVAIIGTGASAIQVIPKAAEIVEHLTVFQRTPIWCLPKPDRALSDRERWLLRWVPGALAAEVGAGGAAGDAGTEPGVRRDQLPAVGALLRDRAARRSGRGGRPAPPAQAGAGSGDAREADPAVRPWL